MTAAGSKGRGCRKEIIRGQGYWIRREQCGRKLAPQRDICKMHVNQEERRKEFDEAFNKKMDFGDAINKEAKALSDKLGIEVTADYNALGPPSRCGYTGRFVVPADWLRKIAGSK